VKITPPYVRTAAWRRISGLGGDPTLPPGSTPPPDCCDVDGEVPDRAAEETSNVVSLSEPTDPGLVQWARDYVTVGAAGSIVLADPVTAGNLLVAVGWYRTAQGNLPTGFTSDDDQQLSPTTNYFRLGHRVAEVGDGDTFAVPITGGSSGNVLIMEWSGIDPPDNILSGAGLPDANPANIDPGTGVPIGVYATDSGNDGRDIFTIAPSTEVYKGYVNVGSDGPEATVGYGAVGDGVDFQAESAIISFHSQEYIVGNYPVAASTGPAWIVPEPLVNDGDDATYEVITNTDLLRIDLAAAFRIVRTRIRIATTTAGARTFTIKGANALDFSDEVTLTTIAFTATGGLTAQDVEGTWLNTTSYRYYELSIGTSDTYRIHSWELYEGTISGDIEAAVETHTADPTDAHDASAISIVDAGAYFTGTDVEAALQELGAGTGGNFLTIDQGGGDELSTIAASGAAETIDLANGNVHDVTMTANCTFTFTSPAAGRARSFTLFARQDGTGSRLATWPVSVVWPGGVTPTLSTAAAAVDVFTFITIDGGAVWYGFPTAASGGSSLTVQDEGTPLATAATTMNFVGAGVVATGAGATKTITISGGSGSVATDAIFDAKGDLPVGTGADTAAKLTVGANDTILMADSGQATGLKWVPSDLDYDDVASAGTADTFSRGDHVHGMPSAGGTGTFYELPTVVRHATQFSSASTTVVATVTAPTAGDNVVAVVYSTGRAPNSVAQTNVVWTQRYTGNGNSAYISVYTGVVSAAAGTSVTASFTGSNNQFIEVFTVTNAASNFTAATASTTATAASTALAILTSTTLTLGDWVIACANGAGAASSYAAMSLPYRTLIPTGGIGRSGILRANAETLNYWSLSASATNYFAAIIVLS
jgi:hypothetical protein